MTGEVILIARRTGNHNYSQERDERHSDRYVRGTYMHMSDTDADADADEEGEAREGGNLGEDEKLIGRSGYDAVDAASGRCMGGSEG